MMSGHEPWRIEEDMSRDLGSLLYMLVFAAGLFLASEAAGEEMVFLRVDDLGTLGKQSFAADYAFEWGLNFGAQNDDFGLRHRLHAGYAVTDWFKLAFEQSLKQRTDTGDLKVGVFSPVVRFSLGSLLPSSVGKWPVDLSTYIGPRIRVTGRRDHSFVLGVGTNTRHSPLHLTANVGLEITLADEASQVNVGPRYNAGIGYEVGAGFLVSAEAWGHAAWWDQGFFEQEHHLGPSLVYFMGLMRFGICAAAGLRDRAAQSLSGDLSGMATFGLKL